LEVTAVASRVSAAEAKAKLPELVAKVAYAGEKYIIERRGKPLAALVGIDDLKRLEAAVSPDRPQGALALVGAWAEVPDEEIEAIFADVMASREQQAGRPAPPFD
jgi:prevent-host-death family protein